MRVTPLSVLVGTFYVLHFAAAFRMFSPPTAMLQSKSHSTVLSVLPSSDSALSTLPSKTAQNDAEIYTSPCKIKVIGVGGGGGNAVNRMISSAAGVSGVELWTVNTDAQALVRSLAPHKLSIGKTTSR